MKQLAQSLLALACTLALTACHTTGPASKPSLPNIVIILADDMGYGDAQCFNPDSKIPTPNLNALAQSGMMFTDAHSAGATCIPARYGLLTGRFPIREQHSTIAPERMTLGTLLKQKDYNTAMVGKWHLGFDEMDKTKWQKHMPGGPCERGFDSFFGLWASLDIPPYFYMRDSHALALPTEQIEKRNATDPQWNQIQGEFWRGGGIAPGFEMEAVTQELTDEAVSVVNRLAGHDKPFFLYFALPSPHTPWLPGEAFRGKSEAGLYGDFVVEVDDCVGRVMAALKEQAVCDNTLVIFTSDNGPVWYAKNTEHFGHSSAGIYKGMKGDSWEGGHRMPFIAAWPEVIPAGSTSDHLISFTDMMATFAAITGQALPDTQAFDSTNIYPLLRGEDTQLPTTHILRNGTVRQGDWKLIPFLGSGGFSKPRRVDPKPGGPQGQLYNLKDDPQETNNLWLEQPEKVKELKDLVQRYQ